MEREEERTAVHPYSGCYADRNTIMASAAADPYTERPPEATLCLVVHAVGGGASVRSIRRLRGGVSSAVHAIDVADAAGRLHRLVLRRFVNADWLAREPDLAEHEARVLALLKDSNVPAPELVAVDAAAEVCDAQAVLMTRLPGRVELAPRDMESWLTRLASVLPAIHAVEAPTSVRPYGAYNNVRELAPPAWSENRDAWAKALDFASGAGPSEATVFIHRDYHPANVLWQHGNVSGVVDWEDASRGPAGIDIGHCRRNLVCLHGVDVADRFLTAYETLAGSRHHPYWDAVTAMDCLPDPGVYRGWTDHGVRGLTEETVRARLDEYIVSIVRRC
ncbi:MAG: aminoglycoside phosphotransferase family protein [Dehalococcoidia bacterium]